MSDLEVVRIGAGPPVLLVHGSVVGAELTWRSQRELAERWLLIIPNRPGFGASPPLERPDFELEAPLFAELLGEGAHLVGHSYGAVIALFAAALRPEAVRSLVVSEPGSLAVAAGVPEVDEMIANGETLYSDPAAITPAAFLRMFRAGAGSARGTPGELPESLARGVELLRRERPPWEAEIPLDALAAAAFPKLVISGGHSSVFDTVCDSLAAAIGAERAVIAGRGHTIPSVGTTYNERLEAFMSTAERARRPDR
ncbi:MAG TPA: alpha/beta fold hydrolase [Solirubrobacterales bacterium]|nr:alpha/beta fold hydrolase [Solirubrobacterales bacterium]